MVLVTGGNGFVGAYLLRYLLEKGAAIRATKRKGSNMDMVADIRDKIEWVDVDVLDVPALEDAFQGVKKVYHSAAVISFNKRDKAMMMEVAQVNGFIHILNLNVQIIELLDF